MSTLPSKLGDLIRLAIKDLEACESTPGYLIEMAEWHTYVPDEDICYVCLAGAVMANTLKVPRDVTDFPALYFEAQLDALDLIRLYLDDPMEQEWDYLAETLQPNYSGLDIDSPVLDTIVAANYHNDPEQFKRSLADLADHFDELNVEFIG